MLNVLQVSKSLLDTAMKAPKRPKAPSPAPQDVASPDVIADLLQFREDSLTGQIGMAMARAMKGAGPSGVLLFTCMRVGGMQLPFGSSHQCHLQAGTSCGTLVLPALSAQPSKQTYRTQLCYTIN